MAELPQNIVDARNTAQAAGSALGDYNAGQYTIADQLKKTVQEALDYNKDIITQRSGALSDYLAAPQAAANQFGVQNFTVGPNAGQVNKDYIFNPFERNNAIAQSIQHKEIPFMTLNALLGMREGTTADTVRAGTAAYNAATARAQGVADNAKSNYSSLLNEYVTQQDILNKQRQLEQDDQRIQLAREAAAKKGAAGGSGLDVLAILEYMNRINNQNNNGGGQQDTAVDPASRFVEEVSDSPWDQRDKLINPTATPAPAPWKWDGKIGF